jgi:hypothetical protein
MALSNQINFLVFFSLRKMTYRNTTVRYCLCPVRWLYAAKFEKIDFAEMADSRSSLRRILQQWQPEKTFLRCTSAAVPTGLKPVLACATSLDYRISTYPAAFSRLHLPVMLQSPNA